MGCSNRFSVRAPAAFVCHFADRGFPLSSSWAVPCGVRYHKTCVCAGTPFATRLAKRTGLQLRHSRFLPRFICECCQVRAMVDRELTDTSRDHALLMLERMRMIDVLNNWADGTLEQYGRHLSTIRDFSDWSGIPALSITPLVAPPTSLCISLMYAHLRFSVGGKTPRKCQTVRQLRSAASAWYVVAAQQQSPDTIYQDKRNHTMEVNGVSPTDTVVFKHFASGMSKRMGVETNPSHALSHVHIAYMDTFFEFQYHTTAGTARQIEIVTAAVVNLVAWLAWLRAGEVFSLCDDDVEITEPGFGATKGLPNNVGVIEMRLQPTTKTNRTSVADLILAYECLSGLSLGKWLGRLCHSRPDGRLFSTPACKRWTSRYFRNTWLYPLLFSQATSGEPSLRAFQDMETIKTAFWSMHSYRRGGRSRCQRISRSNESAHPLRKKASILQVYEHGRWRIRYSSEAMDKRYNEWEVVDRIPITWISM